jgi:hypothetical protein
MSITQKLYRQKVRHSVNNSHNTFSCPVRQVMSIVSQHIYIKSTVILLSLQTEVLQFASVVLVFIIVLFYVLLVFVLFYVLSVFVLFYIEIIHRH